MAIEKNQPRYLGDGVYVTWTGWDFVLTTEREEGTHYIHLEPDMINQLHFFKERALSENTKQD